MRPVATSSGGAGAAGRLGAADPTSAAAEVAAEVTAVLDGLVYTALVRGPAKPEAPAGWLRPVLQRVVVLPGVRPHDQPS